MKLTMDCEDIENSDTLYIRYSTDTPCTSCEYYFGVKDLPNGRKLHAVRRKRNFQKVPFPLNKLRDNSESTIFELFVYYNEIYVPVLTLYLE